ncbi:hypothetical protein BO94DRAFT_540249 [Aspergillus sclerotioniger CBS 115572]|uniref:Coenzyme Q-binding protein COQ10 START domain-containing protein n=1 Tax=Aspergillus sclerotioniger CBS 115572 TaxID=1450535 RepID=A0A317V3B1_9EURO|nr:hypothetical protein BO94DRAFT_540249 [Aspergillus sclerotioniger CBS 115572]PWY68575.1 hypothetical protein BO94DRAFT_540249 [Aspergillus sclerotioniger CBS 115572]
MATGSPSSKASLAANPTPNIAAADAVLHIEGIALIDAPLRDVWDTLLDTSTWPSWNKFAPAVTIRQQPDSDAMQVVSPVLQEGTKLTFHVNMNPASSQPQPRQDVPLIVTEWHPPTSDKKLGRIVWVMDATVQGRIMASLLNAERVHELSEVEIQDADGQMRRMTEVRTWEAQIGTLAYVVRWMYKARLAECFDLWVQNLKEYVELGRLVPHLESYIFNIRA